MKPKTVKTIVQSIDLTASILEIADADTIERSEAQSLLPFIEGDGPRREVAFSAIQGKKKWQRSPTDPIN